MLQSLRFVIILNSSDWPLFWTHLSWQSWSFWCCGSWRQHLSVTTQHPCLSPWWWWIWRPWNMNDDFMAWETALIFLQVINNLYFINPFYSSNTYITALLYCGILNVTGCCRGSWWSFSDTSTRLGGGPWWLWRFFKGTEVQDLFVLTWQMVLTTILNFISVTIKYLKLNHHQFFI